MNCQRCDTNESDYTVVLKDDPSIPVRLCDDCFQMYKCQIATYRESIVYAPEEWPVAPDASELPPPPAEWIDVYYKRRAGMNLTKMLYAIENKTATADQAMNDFKTYINCNITLPKNYKRWRNYAIDRITFLITNDGYDTEWDNPKNFYRPA